VSVLVFLLAVIISPLFTLASLNSIFDLSIEYSFLNWVSAVWLTALLTYKQGTKE
jgi:hypothetical protein